MTTKDERVMMNDLLKLHCIDTVKTIDKIEVGVQQGIEKDGSLEDPLLSVYFQFATPDDDISDTDEVSLYYDDFLDNWQVS